MVCTMRDHACARQSGHADNVREKRRTCGPLTYLVQRLVMNTRTEHRNRHHSALPLQLARAALQQRSPIPRHKVHLVHKEEDRRFGRVLLQRVEAIAIVRRVLDGVVRADLENVYEHADVLKDRRALRREVRIHEGVLAAAVPEVEDEVAEETDVVLLDVDRRAEARRERGGIVGAVQLEKGKKRVAL